MDGRTTFRDAIQTVLLGGIVWGVTATHFSADNKMDEQTEAIRQQTKAICLTSHFQDETCGGQINYERATITPPSP